MVDFLIIGSGLAGAAIAIQLLENGINPKKIVIVGPTNVGYGNAYECDHNEYRLNVRSETMWINPKNKFEFSKWAKLNIKDPKAYHSAGHFYKRNDFAKFVNSKLDKYLKNKELLHHKNIVKRIHRDEFGSWVSCLSNNKKILSKNIILATGNPIPNWPCLIEESILKKNKNLYENPWNGKWIDDTQGREKILLIGSGLSALDCLSVLKSKGHKGHITIVSKSGKFPPVQANWQRRKHPKWPGSINNSLLPSKMINFFKNYLPKKKYSSSEWQSSWEELRQDLNPNWDRISDKDKIKLKRKLYSIWSRLRYRASPQSIKAKDYFLKKGQLTIHSGFAEKIIVNNELLTLKLLDGSTLSSDKIINCSGKGRDMLFDQIIKDKMGMADIFNETLKIDKNFKVLPVKGKDNKGLFLIGPTLISSKGDIVAASKISLQAIDLARTLLNQ